MSDLSSFRVLVSDNVSKLGIDVLKNARVPVDVKIGLKPDALKEIIGNYDALVIRSETKVRKDIIDAAAKLKVVARAGVGVDNVDLTEATNRGIIVVNSPQGNTTAAAEMAWTLLMGLTKKLNKTAPQPLELYNKSLGILGFGNIGQQVARFGKGFGMTVRAYDPFVGKAAGAKMGVEIADLDTVIANSDVISVHLPSTKDTKNIINAARMKSMRKGAIIVNASRGDVVDAVALTEALQSGHLGGAGLDVFAKEPLAKDSPLRGLDNIVLSPHLGASTIEAQVSVAIDVCEQVVDILSGRPARTAVNIPSMKPQMIKPVQKYIILAERLGLVVGQLCKQLRSIHIEYYGSAFENKDVAPLGTVVMKGVFSAFSARGSVNFVNAMVKAKEQGVQVSAKKLPSENYTGAIRVRAEGELGETVLTGIVNEGYGERIVEFNGFSVDVVPEGQLLCMSHTDQPGIIGKLGSLLGERNINIVSMDVGRLVRGGAAVVLAQVDQTISEDTLEILRTAFPGTNLQPVNLPTIQSNPRSKL